MMFVAALTGISMFLLKEVVDRIFIEKNVIMLVKLVILIPLVFFLKGAFNYAQTYLMNYIGHNIVMDLRNELYEKLHSLSLDFYTKNATGEIMARLTNDISLIQYAFTKIPANIIRDGFIVIILAALLGYLHLTFAVVALMGFPPAIYLIVRLGKKLRRIARKTQSKMADLYSILQETVSGIKIVKAFGMENYEIKKFSRENKQYYNIIMRSVRVEALTGPLMEFIGVIGLTIIVWFGGRDVINGVWTAGSFFAFMGAVFSTYNPVRNLSNLNNVMQQALAASERVFSIIDEVPTIVEIKSPISLSQIKHEISFHNIHLSYNNEGFVLKGINLKVEKGRIIALVGPSGGGKTSLVNLITRFYDPTEGAITIDGIDIKSASLKSLREQMGIVTQETILFNDTVRNNIAYGKLDVTEEEIVRACKIANAHDFVCDMENGYRTVIGERGVILSGGQKQRLAIARAVLKNPAILILDEATSALDTESELLVQEALDRLMKGRTAFVIAHRLSTIIKADTIVVIDKGIIVGKGVHSELIKNCTLYKRLYEMQFREV